ncbi:MAG TPA: ATP-binding protein [Patescibacteria group bacterium]|nr:ATP-binding protein [Patescibacteria group bacterium]
MMESSADLEKFKLAVDNAYDHIIITDSDAKILYANAAATKITGYSLQEMLGQNPRLWGGNMGKKFYEDMWKIIKIDKHTFHGEVNNIRKGGRPYTAEVSISPVLNDKGEIVYFVGIERDITREKDIDRMKTEFVSLASHQLRTPLTAVKWFIEMLLDGDAGTLNDEQSKYLRNVYQSNERMIELVNSLLNVSRIESGRIIVEPSPTNIASLVNEVVSKLKPTMAEKDIKLVLKIEDNIPSIDLDQKLVFNVYENLLVNSTKYSFPEGVITLAIYKEGEFLISAVEDHGVGIPTHEQERVFLKFYRGTNVVKEHSEGSGLGLYLAKAIVESSGGKIWFKSEEGKGSTFYFSLPLSGMKSKSGEVTLSA